MTSPLASPSALSPAQSLSPPGRTFTDRTASGPYAEDGWRASPPSHHGFGPLEGTPPRGHFPGEAGSPGRRRLQLKPRSKPLDKAEEAPCARSSVFGAARPREAVLLDRGIDPESGSDISVLKQPGARIEPNMWQKVAGPKRSNSVGKSPPGRAGGPNLTFEEEEEFVTEVANVFDALGAGDE